MKFSKFNLLMGVALSGVILIGCQTESKAALEDNVLKLVDTLGSKGASSLCRKGKFFEGLFSLRSLEGNLCTLKYVAAFAVSTCADYKDSDGPFMNSQCAKNAAKLGITDKATANQVLAESVQKGVGKAKALVCSKKDKLPAQTAIVANKVCPAVAG